MAKTSTLFPGFVFSADDPHFDTPAAAPDAIKALWPQKDKTYAHIHKAIIGKITKEPLLKLAGDIAMKIIDRKIIFTTSHGTAMTRTAIEKQLGGRLDRLYMLDKGRLLSLLMPLLMDLAPFRRWLSTYSTEVEQIWMEALLDYQVSGDQIEKIQPASRRLLHRGDISITPLHLLYNPDYGRFYPYYRSALIIPAPLALLQAEQYAATNTPPTTTTPPHDYTTFATHDFIDNFDNIDISLRTTPLEYTQKSALTVSSVKALQKGLRLSTFPDDAPTVWRMRIIATIFPTLIKSHRTPQDFIRAIPAQLEHLKEIQICAAIPLSSTLKHTYSIFSFLHIVLDKILPKLKTLPSDKWTDTSAIELTMRTEELQNPVRTYYSAATPDPLDNTLLTFCRIIPRAIYFILTAFGIIDIAAEHPDTPLTSGSLYLRLTPLGSYALRITDRMPEPTVSASRQFLEIDEANHTITLLSTPNPYTPLLDTLCIQESPTLYRLDQRRFLSACADATQLNNQIDLFRRHILSGDKHLFASFFKDLHTHIDRVHLIHTGHYHIYHIDPADTSLLHLIETNPTLRAFTLRAEGHRLLVPTSRELDFITILRRNGYIPQ